MAPFDKLLLIPLLAAHQDKPSQHITRDICVALCSSCYLPCFQFDPLVTRFVSNQGTQIFWIDKSTTHYVNEYNIRVPQSLIQVLNALGVC